MGVSDARRGSGDTAPPGAGSSLASEGAGVFADPLEADLFQNRAGGRVVQ